MINGLGLLLSFTMSFPGDVPVKPLNRIEDIGHVQNLSLELKTTVFTFTVGSNPMFHGNVILDGSALRF